MLIVVACANACVSIVFVVSALFVFVFAPTTEAEIVARTLILLALNVLPKSIVSVFPLG